MTTTLEAVYEEGVLKLSNPLPLPNNVKVVVTVSIRDDSLGGSAGWRDLSKASLEKTWDNSDDEVFNELLQG